VKLEVQSSRIVQKTVLEGAGDGRMSVTIGFLFAGCLVKARVPGFLRRRALRNWRAKIDVGRIYGTKPQGRTDKIRW
jgi:hypothetical protein